MNKRPGELAEEDPMEKVRRFLEKQGGLGQIEEFNSTRSPRKSSRGKERQKSAEASPRPPFRERQAMTSAI